MNYIYLYSRHCKPMTFVLLLAMILAPYLRFGDFGQPIILFFLVTFYGGSKGLLANRQALWCFSFVYVLCMFSSIAYFVTGLMEFKYATRGISTSINSLLFVFFSFVFYSQYKNRLLDYLSIAFLLAYSIVVVQALMIFGIGPVVEAVFSIFHGGMQSAGLETDKVLECTHAILLSTPLLSLYWLYLYIEEREKKQLIFCLLLLVVSLLAYKRIAIGAMLVVAILYCLKPMFGKIFLLLSGVCVVVGILLYITIIKDGTIYLICSEYDIDLMFRDVLWPAFSKYYNLDWTFVGQGWDFITKYLQENNVSLFGSKIGGLHNDILRIYIDLGFIGSIVYWLSLFLFIPLWLIKKGEKESAFFYWLCQVYFLMIYTTDNALIYLACQLVANIIPLTKLGTSKKHNTTSKVHLR